MANNTPIFVVIMDIIINNDNDVHKKIAICTKGLSGPIGKYGIVYFLRKKIKI